MSRFLGITLATFIVLVQVVLVPGSDLHVVTNSSCAIFGTLAFLAIGWRMRGFFWIVFVPFLAALSTYAFYRVPGYSEYRLAEMFGWTCFLIVCAHAEKKWIIRALAASVLIQIAWKLCGVPGWAMALPDVYTWGTWRNNLRFSSWILAGIVCGLKMVESEHESQGLFCFGLVCALAGTAAVWFAHGHTAIIVCAAVWVVWTWRWFNKQTAFILLAIGIVFVLFSGLIAEFPTGGGMCGRGGMWLTVIKSVLSWPAAMVGHGYGSYFLQIGCHPHCEAMNVLYEQGAGGLILCAVAGCVLLLAVTDFTLGMGALAILACAMTNSLRYPPVALAFCLLAGMALHDGEKTKRTTSKSIAFSVSMVFALYAFTFLKMNVISAYLVQNATNLESIYKIPTLEAKYRTACLLTSRAAKEKNWPALDRVRGAYQRMYAVAPAYKDVGDRLKKIDLVLKAAHYEKNSP